MNKKIPFEDTQNDIKEIKKYLNILKDTKSNKGTEGVNLDGGY